MQFHRHPPRKEGKYDRPTKPNKREDKHKKANTKWETNEAL